MRTRLAAPTDDDAQRRYWLARLLHALTGSARARTAASSGTLVVYPTITQNLEIACPVCREQLWSSFRKASDAGAGTHLWWQWPLDELNAIAGQLVAEHQCEMTE